MKMFLRATGCILACFAFGVLCSEVAGCIATYDSARGFKYSVAFVSTGNHEVDRLAVDATDRAKMECYVHGRRHEDLVETGIEVWTDNALDSPLDDSLDPGYPDCAREDFFLQDLRDAIQVGGLTAQDLAGVTVLQVWPHPSCKSEEGVFNTYELCENGYVIEIARSLDRKERQTALQAGMRALMEARTIKGAWSGWGLGEPTGFYNPTVEQSRMDAYTQLPGWRQ